MSNTSVVRESACFGGFWEVQVLLVVLFIEEARIQPLKKRKRTNTLHTTTQQH
jgi:hypothetical protein